MQILILQILDEKEENEWRIWNSQLEGKWKQALTNTVFLDIYMLSHLILAPLRSSYNLHFTDVETEVQRERTLS